MGHWSESLLDEAAQQIGGSPDRRLLMDLCIQAGRELDILAGRSFRPLRRTTSVFVPNGLPFVDVPDMQVGSVEAAAGAWEIPNPVNRQTADVLQVSSFADPTPKAAPIADALWFAGQLLADASQTGLLSRDYVLHWLGVSVDREQRVDLMRRVMDPAVRFSVPILGVSVGGWWIQIARRLIWVTSETEDEGRLIELLLSDTMIDGKVVPLAAVEPILIAARMTRQPAAATLLEQLIRPGFDPAQGAEATRRYVRRKASIAVMQYRKGEAPDRYPWKQVGISERRYYKLLPRIAQKVNGRYVLDHDDVVARMKAYLDRVDHLRAVRAAALDVLRSHGFGEEAARKWLQRHRPEETVAAWPRGPRP